MRIQAIALCSLFLLGGCSSPEPAAEHAAEPTAYLPGNRVLMHAHNCYPYEGRWADRMDRALSTGAPLVIEQDLIWFAGADGAHRSIVAHECPCTGEEPGLKEHFFERVRPIVENALADGDRSQWPLIYLHIDIKNNQPEHIAAIWELLGEYEDWLTTASRTADPAEIAPLDLKPVMVISEYRPEREEGFHDEVPVGEKLRVFGAVKPMEPDESLTKEQTAEWNVSTPPEKMIDGGKTNYRRWWNLSWHAIESGGAPGAGEWTPEDSARLDSIVDYGHSIGIWVRIYCLNGHDPEDKSNGWGRGYNFGSPEAVRLRWHAARDARVDFLATDQFEELAEILRQQ